MMVGVAPHWDLSLSANARQLLMLIETSPGCTLGDAKGRSNTGETAFYTALGELLVTKKVCQCEVGRLKCLFPYSANITTWGPQFVALRDQDLAKLYRALESLELPSTSEVQDFAREAFGWDRKCVARRLDLLESAGLVVPYYQTNELNRIKLRTLTVHPEAEAMLDALEGQETDY